MKWPHLQKSRYLPWTLIMILLAGLSVSLAAFSMQTIKNLQFMIFILGLLVTTLAAFLARILINNQKRIDIEVLRRTHELAEENIKLQHEVEIKGKLEKKLTEKQKELQKRHEALQSLTKFTTSEFKSAIQEVILRTSDVMQVDRVGVWLYEKFDHTPLLTCSSLYIRSTQSFSNHLEFTSLNYPSYFAALSTHSPLIIPSLSDEDLNRELFSYLASFHIVSKMDIPFFFENTLLGVLSCEETKGQRDWPLEDRDFGQSIADIIAIIMEQSARRKIEMELLESEERLNFITQNSIDGIISINEREEIIFWNFGAEQMFGYSEEEIIGKQLQLVLPQPSFFKTEFPSAKPFELIGKRKNGHAFPVEISYTHWVKKDLQYDTIIIRDITDRKAAEKRLIKAMNDAKAANESKNEFLAMVSHELRTPLNAIIGFGQCLLMGMDGHINNAQRMSLKKIEKSSFHLLNLINDILDWSKIEAHRMKLEIMKVNIVEIVMSCIEEMQSLAKQKNLIISLVMPQPILFIDIDKVRIRQVLLNLLSNAIKFTDQGTIIVSIIDEPEQLTIQIKDTGIGLLPHEIEKIFRPFTQADRSITRRYGGTGLGLMISKKILDLHGGSILVESEKGIGSTFSISLPKSR